MADDTKVDIEKLLDAVNGSSQNVATLHVGFLAFIAYVGVIVWSTSHEDLLRNSPVKLPILDAELPLDTFFLIVPWMLVLLHFNLLLQLAMLATKLNSFNSTLLSLSVSDYVRDRLNIFPFTQVLAGRKRGLLLYLLIWGAVGLTVVVLPLGLLLGTQLRFIAYHSEWITTLQRCAVWTDAAMLAMLWSAIGASNFKFAVWCRVRFERFWLLGWLKHRLMSLPRRLIGTLPQPVPVAVAVALKDQLATSQKVPISSILLLCSVLTASIAALLILVPGDYQFEKQQPVLVAIDQPRQACEKSELHPLRQPEKPITYLEDQLIERFEGLGWTSFVSINVTTYDKLTSELGSICKPVVSSVAGTLKAVNAETEEKKKTGKEIFVTTSVRFGPCWLHKHFGYSRNLNLRDAVLVPKNIPAAQITAATGVDFEARANALQQIPGLSLKDRDLRNADFRDAVLVNANLHHAKLQGTLFFGAKLSGIEAWDGTRFTQAGLGGAQLQSARASYADMRGVDLTGAELRGADVSCAHMEGADLRGLHGQDAILHDTFFDFANLRSAELTGASLTCASLAGATVERADFLDAGLRNANLQTIPAIARDGCPYTPSLTDLPSQLKLFVSETVSNERAQQSCPRVGTPDPDACRKQIRK